MWFFQSLSRQFGGSDTTSQLLERPAEFEPELPAELEAIEAKVAQTIIRSDTKEMQDENQNLKKLGVEPWAWLAGPPHRVDWSRRGSLSKDNKKASLNNSELNIQAPLAASSAASSAALSAAIKAACTAAPLAEPLPWTPETCACQALKIAMMDSLVNSTKEHGSSAEVPRGTGLWPVSIPLKSIKVGAKEGCRLCTVICSIVWNLGIVHIWDPQGVEGVWPWKSEIQFEDSRGRFTIASKHFELFKMEDKCKETELETILKLRPYFCTTGSDETFATIKEWISNCMQTHPVCASEKVIGNPGRILDLESPDEIRILELDTQIQQDYICLSYCWGTVQTITTTHATLDVHKRGIPIVSLPQTFRDAIHICRKLGVYRLWIDALCIIQDDLKDWEIESAKMASIYAGACLTIAASNGDASESGCFHEPRNTPYLIKVNGKSTNLSVRMQERHDNFIQDVFLSSTAPAPLFTRGWALQERLLSKRILHYTKSEVVWECTTCMDCQCGGIGSTSYEHLKCEFGSIDSAKVDGVENLLTLWLKLVQNYTHRKLTKSRDKYPALSGLAHKFAEKGAGYYLAGHWTRDLAQSLLWRPLMGYSRLEATPSWSWASFSGPVRFVVLLQSDEDSAQNCLVEILDMQGELNMQSPFGAPLKAELVVRARAVEGIYGTYDFGTRVFNRRNGLDLNIRPDDDSDLGRLQQFWGEMYFTNSSRFKPSMDLVYDAYEIAHQSRNGLHLKNLKLFFPTVFCLLWSQPANLEKEDSRVYVLVVGQWYADRKGVYRRLAICDMRASEHMPLRASDGEASADLFFEGAQLMEFTLI